MISTRASMAQMNTMIEFFEKHRFLAHGRAPNPDARMEAKNLWRKLATKLNSMGGAVKDVATWKKCWNDKRTTVKKICAKQMRSMRQKTGRIDLSQLSPIDRKILAILGESSVKPMVQVAVSPFPKIDKIMETATEPTIKEPLSPASSTYDDSETHQNQPPQHDSDALSDNSEAAEPMMEHFILEPVLEPASEPVGHRASTPTRKKRRYVDHVRQQLMNIEERRVEAESRLAQAVEKLGEHPLSQAVMEALLATTEAQQATAREQAEAAREQAESARQQAEVARQQSEAARQQAEASRQQAEAARMQAEVARALLEEIRSRNEKLI